MEPATNIQWMYSAEERLKFEVGPAMLDSNPVRVDWLELVVAPEVDAEESSFDLSEEDGSIEEEIYIFSPTIRVI